MRNKFRDTLLMIFGVVLTAAVPALAHHSFTAEFNQEKLATFTGTLTQIDWINPHVQLYLDAKDANGLTSKWKIESGPTVHFRSAGLTRNMFTIGQLFTVQTYLAKDGTKNFGFMRSITFVGGPNDGHRYVLGSGGGLDVNGNPVQ
jgi:hypothetical protein